MVAVQKLKMIHLVFLDQVLDFRVIIEIHNTIIALISYFIIAGVNIFLRGNTRDLILTFGVNYDRILSNFGSIKC